MDFEAICCEVISGGVRVSEGRGGKGGGLARRATKEGVSERLKDCLWIFGFEPSIELDGIPVCHSGYEITRNSPPAPPSRRKIAAFCCLRTFSRLLMSDLHLPPSCGLLDNCGDLVSKFLHAASPSTRKPLAKMALAKHDFAFGDTE